MKYKIYSFARAKNKQENIYTENEGTLLPVLQDEKKHQRSGGIYHKIQVEFTYNSNRIEENSLTYEQIRYIYETNTILIMNTPIKVDDIVKTTRHFCCINEIIDKAEYRLSEAFIKRLHSVLENGNRNLRENWSEMGKYKPPNKVRQYNTAAPEEVKKKMKSLLASYNAAKRHTLEEIIDFHHDFECIRPFQRGNGRVGRLILFKECLKNNIVPFIIEDDLKALYYRGMCEWDRDRSHLMDFFRIEQDKFKMYLNYFQIKYID